MDSLKNRVKLMGYVGFDPEVREIAKGRKVARVSVATHSGHIDQNGDHVQTTEWHTVVAWGNMAEMMEKMLRKGYSVAMEGRLVHRSYEGKNGQKRYVTEVVLSDLQLLSSGTKAA